MTTEIEPRMAAELVLPGSGEMVDVSTPDGAGYALKALDGWYGELRDYLVSVLHEEAEQRGTKTLHLAEVTVEVWGGPDARLVWDVEKLRDLITQAGLPQERIDLLIRTKVTYDVDGNVARQLRGANPAYAAALDAAVEHAPARRGAKAK